MKPVMKFGVFFCFFLFFFLFIGPCTDDWSAWSSSTGHVGVPLPCNIVKLVDVEEMNYFASNGEGEVRLGSKDVMV